MVVFLLISGLCSFGIEESLAQAGNIQEEVERLIERLKDEDVLARSDAAEALGQIGPEAAPAVEALVEALKDEAAGVRLHAAMALGGIGPEAAPAVEGLIETLQDEDAGVRLSAAELVGGKSSGFALVLCHAGKLWLRTRR